MILSQTFSPEIKEAIEHSSFLSWAQRAPVKEGLVTFSHSNKRNLVTGRVLVYKAIEGYAINYTADEPFNGLWTRYEKPGYRTEPFTTITICDEYPEEVRLWTPDGSLVDHTMQPYDVSVVTNFLSMRVDEKYAEMQKIPVGIQ